MPAEFRGCPVNAPANTPISAKNSILNTSDEAQSTAEEQRLQALLNAKRFRREQRDYAKLGYADAVDKVAQAEAEVRGIEEQALQIIARAKPEYVAIDFSRFPPKIWLESVRDYEDKKALKRLLPAIIRELKRTKILPAKRHLEAVKEANKQFLRGVNLKEIKRVPEPVKPPSVPLPPGYFLPVGSPVAGAGMSADAVARALGRTRG